MEENEILDEQQFPITAALQKEIDAKVAELKASNPKLKVVFPIVVEGEEYDDKPLYVAYFRQPDFKTFSKYLTAMQKDSAIAMRTLANDCFLAGDKELVDDDSLFLFGTMGQMNRITAMRQARLVNLSKPGK